VGGIPQPLRKEQMKKIYKQRLLKLAKYLQTNVKPKNFDMQSICNLGEELDHVWNPKKDRYDPFDCGSTCCAVGYSPLCFPELNLVYDFANQEIKRNGCVWYGFKFFGITENQWQYLFGVDDANYNTREETPKQVARRIIRFVESDGTIPSNFQADY
jgi:hypothetical protein